MDQGFPLPLPKEQTEIIALVLVHYDHHDS